MKINEIPARPNWFRRVLAPPKFVDVDKTQTALYLSIFLIAGIVLLGTRIAISVLQNELPPKDNIILTGVTLVMIVLLVIMRRGYVLAASIALLAIVFAGMLYVASGAGATGIFDGSFMALVMLIIMAGLLLGEQAAVVMTALSIAAAWWLANQNVSQPETFPKDTPITYARDVTIILIALGFLIYMLIRSLRQTLKLSRASEQSLREQNVELTKIQATLEKHVTERTTQLQASADVSRATSSILNTEQLLREAVKLIGERFDFYYVAIFAVDDSGRWAVLREATGEAGQQLKDQGHALAISGQSMVGNAIRLRKSRIALDVGAEAVRFANPLLPDTHSEIALPLLVGDRVFGALDVQSAQPAAFDEGYAIFLQGMADQIGVALNTAEQYQREQAHIEQTNHLLRAAIELTEQTDRAALENRLVDLAVSLLNADTAQLWIKHENDIELKAMRRTWRVQEDQDLSFNRDRIDQVFQTGQLVNLNRSMAQADYTSRIAEAPFFAAIIAPIISHGNITGVLNITHSQIGRLFTPEDENSAQLLATQVATALENITLVEQQQRTLDELNIVNRRLIRQAWEKYTQVSGQIGGEWRRGQWIRADKLGSAVQPNAAQPPTVADGALQPFTATAQTMQLPIQVRGETIGEFTLQPAEGQREWATEDITFAQALVDQASQMIENARLLEGTERLANRERTINEINSRVRQTVNVDAILKTAVNELGRSFQAARVFVRISPPVKDAAAPSDSERRVESA